MTTHTCPHTHTHARTIEYPVVPSVFCEDDCLPCCVTSLPFTSSFGGHVIWVTQLPSQHPSSLLVQASHRVRYRLLQHAAWLNGHFEGLTFAKVTQPNIFTFTFIHPQHCSQHEMPSVTSVYNPSSNIMYTFQKSIIINMWYRQALPRCIPLYFPKATKLPKIINMSKLIAEKYV